MTGNSGGEITRLLNAWKSGEETALEQVVALLYPELHLRARRCMAREAPGHTLQTTALINEVYLRLVDLPERNWENRAHFLAVCAQLMRRILIDIARSRHSQKRGGGPREVRLDEALTVCTESPHELIAVDRALKNLSFLDPRKGSVVELRFFGGLSIEETAEVLQVSRETVIRDWKLAKVWLLREIGGSR